MATYNEILADLNTPSGIVNFVFDNNPEAVMEKLNLMGKFPTSFEAAENLILNTYRTDPGILEALKVRYQYANNWTAQVAGGGFDYIPTEDEWELAMFGPEIPGAPRAGFLAGAITFLQGLIPGLAGLFGSGNTNTQETEAQRLAREAAEREQKFQNMLVTIAVIFGSIIVLAVVIWLLFTLTPKRAAKAAAFILALVNVLPFI